jgi:predicted transcriptional regulator of viral defense system
MAKSDAKVRLGRVASRQWGRVTWAQIRELGVPEAIITAWLRAGYLHRIHPRVYAIGHRAPSVGADLAAALLYAGPGAMLSHATAAWWLGLIDDRPSTIHVSTPRRCRSRRGLRVHQRRECTRVWHRGMPVTSVARTLLDYGSQASLSRTRKALANAEYRRVLDVSEVRAVIGRGRAGSARLRKAVERHQPTLALTRSPLEDTFFGLCEGSAVPIPEVNARIEGWTVDFLWRREGLVVEVDGYGNHHTRAQVDRDRRKELCLRGAGLMVARYSEDQIEDEPQRVIADVAATLERCRSGRVAEGLT